MLKRKEHTQSTRFPTKITRSNAANKIVEMPRIKLRASRMLKYHFVMAIDTTITNRTNGQRTEVSNDRSKHKLKFCEGFSFNIMYTLILHQIYPNRTHARIKLLLAIFKIKYK